jgi:hypothetical protein
MPSPTYKLFAEAMAARRPIVCLYDAIRVRSVRSFWGTPAE